MRETNYNKVLDEVLDEVKQATEATSEKVASVEPTSELAQDLIKVADYLRSLDEVQVGDQITLDDVRKYVEERYGSR